MNIVLRGTVPGKKNRRGIKAGGRGLYTPPEVKAQLASLQLQLQAQLGSLRGLRHPDLKICFHISNPGIDRDNAETALFDLMKKAGMIVDDSIRHFNGTVVSLPAKIVEPGNECVVIVVEDSQVLVDSTSYSSKSNLGGKTG